MLFSSKIGPMHSHRCVNCRIEVFHSDLDRYAYPMPDFLRAAIELEHRCPICRIPYPGIWDEDDSDLWDIVTREQVRMSIQCLSYEERGIIIRSPNAALSGLRGEIARRMYFWCKGKRISVFPELDTVITDQVTC